MDALDGREHFDEDDAVRVRSELTPRKEDGTKAVIVELELKDKELQNCRIVECIQNGVRADEEVLSRDVWWEEDLRL